MFLYLFVFNLSLGGKSKEKKKKILKFFLWINKKEEIENFEKYFIFIFFWYLGILIRDVWFFSKKMFF